MNKHTDEQKKRSFFQGFSFSSFLIGMGLCAIAVFAAIYLFGSKSTDVSNKPGHTFEVDLTGVPEGTGAVQTGTFGDYNAISFNGNNVFQPIRDAA